MAETSRRLAGRTALVTGAGRGIGEAIARRFGAEGARVVCVDLSPDSAERTADAIGEAGGEAICLGIDVRRADEMIGFAADHYGRLDVLVANAAHQVMGSLDVTGPLEWDAMYEVNVKAVAGSVKAALPLLRAAGGGSIVLVSSVLGLTGDRDLPMYGATKGALRALCRSIAAAHGPENIRCNTICPGDVDTEMVREFFDFQPDPAASRAEIERKYPLRRLAQPADVAGAALFLASDDAAYVSGVDLVVDGGLLANVY
ncbi:SDR family NAD(P)-dependent oxidoreductase [Lentzea sp. NPDC059081]|uniref:SDR family NAD(P)-dependent oxidoreductase n=1 Tax=Lentzea sp. NPDC059081 TaxID=3346719 RepID=UPI003679FC78